MKINKIMLIVLTSILFFPLNNLAADKTNAEYETISQQSITALDKGDYLKGTELAKKALILSQQQYGEKHFNTLMSLTVLGRLYKAQGRYELAEPICPVPCSTALSWRTDDQGRSAH